MAQFYGSITDMVIKTTLGKMATLKYTAAPQSLTFTYTSWPRVDTSTTDRNYSYRTGNFPPTTGNANFLITNGSGILQNIWNISERGQYKEVLKYNNMSIPQRRVVWMWFGAFPGAFGLGRAQPQRRGTSP